METIEQIKRKLEILIFEYDGVLGIGTLFENNEKFIEISVRDLVSKSKVEQFLTPERTHNYPVKIVIRNQTSIK